MRTTGLTITAAAAAAAAALLGLAPLGCGRGPTAPAPHVGTADITVASAAGGTRALVNAEAGFYVYSPGFPASARAMILTVGGGTPTRDAVRVEFFHMLLPDADAPTVGAFAVEDSQTSVDVYMSEGGALRQFVAVGGADSITIVSATSERVSGRFRVTVGHSVPMPVPEVVISGTFTAERVSAVTDLPLH